MTPEIYLSQNIPGDSETNPGRPRGRHISTSKKNIAYNNYITGNTTSRFNPRRIVLTFKIIATISINVSGPTNISNHKLFFIIRVIIFTAKTVEINKIPATVVTDN